MDPSALAARSRLNPHFRHRFNGTTVGPFPEQPPVWSGETLPWPPNGPKGDAPRRSCRKIPPFPVRDSNPVRPGPVPLSPS